MAITDKINEIIYRRIERNAYEGQGLHDVVRLNFLFNAKY